MVDAYIQVLLVVVIYNPNAQQAIAKFFACLQRIYRNLFFSCLNIFVRRKNGRNFFIENLT